MAAASVAITETFPAPEMTLHMKLASKSSTSMIPHPPTMAKPRGKLRIDPQRALEPARKKLSTVEAQRIMAVLQDTIRRTQLLTALPHVLQNLERYKIVLGSDLCQMLEGHRVIIQSFEELKTNAEKLLEKEKRSESPKSNAGSAAEEQDLEGKIHNFVFDSSLYCKSLCPYCTSVYLIETERRTIGKGNGCFIKLLGHWLIRLKWSSSPDSGHCYKYNDEFSVF